MIESKITAIDLPTGWELSDINKVTHIRTGKLDANAAVADGKFPFFTCAEEISKIDSYSFDTEAVLFAGNGFFNLKWFKGKFDAYQRTYVIEPQGIEGKFLYFQLLGLLPEITSKSRGSTIKYLRLGDIQETPFLIPPLAEQTRIVTKLEELLTDLDHGVAEMKAAQKKLGQYRQSLLKAAVEGQLTAQWRAQQQQPATATGQAPETGAQLLARILTERRQRWEAKQLAKFAEQGKTPPKNWQSKYPKPVQPDTTGLPELPQGWVWASVDQLLSEIETGKSFKCEERPPYATEVGVAKVSAVSWGEYDEKESKTCHDEKMIRPEFFIRNEDFLFSRANTIELVGACVIALNVSKQIMLSDKILRLVLVSSNLKVWLLTLLRSKFGRKYIETLASGNQESMRNIGQERLRQIPIPLPSLFEVAEASALLSHANKAVEAQEIAIKYALKQSAAQRQNILRAAFAGELVPQDPHDEPASVLLERIRAERAAAAAAAGKKPKTAPRKRHSHD